MHKIPSFEKIKNFVQDQSSEALVIRPMANGFNVNGLRITNSEDRWHILDKSGFEHAQFFSRKLAVLCAIIISKNMIGKIHLLSHLDRRLAIATEDHRNFLQLVKVSDEKSTPVYEARLDRARQLMEDVKSQVTLVEKSLSLL